MSDKITIFVAKNINANRYTDKIYTNTKSVNQEDPLQQSPIIYVSGPRVACINNAYIRGCFLLSDRLTHCYAKTMHLFGKIWLLEF